MKKAFVGLASFPGWPRLLVRGRKGRPGTTYVDVQD